MNILICDDNTAFAMQLQKDINEYFHNPNININVVTDHFDQIEGTYDVIFMDIELNDKNKDLLDDKTAETLAYWLANTVGTDVKNVIINDTDGKCI